MMENMYVNRCLTWLVIREMKIKTTTKYHYILARMVLKTHTRYEVLAIATSWSSSRFGKQFGSFLYS